MGCCCIESTMRKGFDEMQENLLDDLDKKNKQQKKNRKEQLLRMEANLDATLNHDGSLLIPIGMATGKIKEQVPDHIKEYINLNTYKQLCTEIQAIVQPVIQFIEKLDDENGEIFGNAFGRAFDGHKQTRKLNPLNPKFTTKLMENSHQRSTELHKDIQNTRNRQIEASNKINQMEKDINELLYKWNMEQLKQLKLHIRLVMVKSTVNLHGGTIQVGQSTFMRIVKKMVLCVRIVDKKEQFSQNSYQHGGNESIEDPQVEVNQQMSHEEIEKLKKQMIEQNQQNIKNQQELVLKQQQQRQQLMEKKMKLMSNLN